MKNAGITLSLFMAVALLARNYAYLASYLEKTILPFVYCRTGYAH
jgi:hypothetical protein